MSDRKKDHIDLAFSSQVLEAKNFDLDYEPMLSPLSSEKIDLGTQFLGAQFDYPLWFSSMTGGTEHAYKINSNMAKVANKFNLGMGLGSCRPLLEDKTLLKDFDMRKQIGDRPLYSNIGIAQVNELVNQNNLSKLSDLVNQLQANGLIIHVNPLQEMAQPEGDRWNDSPIDLIKRVIDQTQTNIIVKEVGQGFGPRSLKSLLELPLSAIDFAALGGTNFTMLEGTRHETLHNDKRDAIYNLANVGQAAEQMLTDLSSILNSGFVPKCNEVIISGGVKNFIHGHSLLLKSPLNAIYGQAKNILEKAIQGEDELSAYIEAQIYGLELAKRFLYLKEDC